VTPPTAGSVAVTPDGATVDRLPSNGTQYSQVFRVTNTGNSGDTFALSASSGAILSIVSVDGVAGSTGSASLAPAGFTDVTVVYTVANNAAAGATASLSLGATSGNNSARTGGASATITVVKALLAMTKEAYKLDQTTLITGAMKVLPGDTIQYKIAITNNGTAASQTISISDPLPSQVTFLSTTEDVAGDWTFPVMVGTTVVAKLNGTLAPGATRFVWVTVRVQ
jgi:uncharacterized repeat protein (TIGR01451 family)